MTTARTRLSRRAAERILDHRGDPSDPAARLVAAVSAPAAGPAAGEDQATALFRTATGLVPVAGSGGAPALARLTRKLAALPAAGVAAAALALGGGGLALAATQGAVNVPFTGHDNRSDHAPAAPSSKNPGLSQTPGAGTTPGAPGATHLPSATPSPSLRGLCEAYRAGAVPRKASNPAFAALSTAAGGAEGVGGYCTGLLGTPATPTHPAPSATPTHPVPDHTTTPPVPRPTRAVSPTIPAKPRQAVSPTTPPRPEAAHE